VCLGCGLECGLEREASVPKAFITTCGHCKMLLELCCESQVARCGNSRHEAAHLADARDLNIEQGKDNTRNVSVNNHGCRGLEWYGFELHKPHRLVATDLGHRKVLRHGEHTMKECKTNSCV
jgi:hypothetical protein